MKGGGNRQRKRGKKENGKRIKGKTIEKKKKLVPTRGEGVEGKKKENGKKKCQQRWLGGEENMSFKYSNHQGRIFHFKTNLDTHAAVRFEANELGSSLLHDLGLTGGEDHLKDIIVEMR